MMPQFRKTVAVAVATLVGSLSTQAYASNTALGIQWADFGQSVDTQPGMKTDGVNVIFDVISTVSHGQGTRFADFSLAYGSVAQTVAQYDVTIPHDGRGVGLEHIAKLDMDSGVVSVTGYLQGAGFAEFLAQQTDTLIYDGRGVGLVNVTGVSPDLDATPATFYNQDAPFAGFSDAQAAMTDALPEYGSTLLYDGRGVGLQKASLDLGMFATTAD